MGFHLDGELFITGRIADHIVIDGRNFYPQDVEATAADASSTVRRGYVAAFPIPTADGKRLVVIAERAAGSSRADPAAALDAIRSEVLHHHGLSLQDVKILPAGAIPRTTSGKLARRACRAEYLAGAWS